MATQLAVIARLAGGNLLPPNKTHSNRMEIPSSDGRRMYVVAQANSGQWQCGCPGWIRHRHCKHLTAMLPHLTKIKRIGR
jgi:hypothetical protein